MTKIRLSETKPGDTVIIAGREYTVLDTDFQGGVFCLAKEIAFYAAFDKGNCNNWATSSLQKILNGDFRKGIEDEIGAEALIAIERDLTSDDGLKDYGICRDKITLITCDEYRKYRYQIPNKDDSWLRTPYSSTSYLARLVYTDGSLNLDDAYYGYFGVVPGLCILSSLKVSDTVDSDGCYVVQWNAAPTITVESTSLGDKNAGFDIEYVIGDADGDTVSATLAIDGTVKQTIAQVTLDATNTYTVTTEALRELTLGSHTITITATDSASNVTTQNITFQRVVSDVTISGSDADLGNKWTPPLITYSVNDSAALRVDVTETIDGETTRTIENAELGSTYQFDITSFATLDDEETHTLTITAVNADSSSATRTYTFTKIPDKLEFYTNTIPTDEAAEKINVVVNYDTTGNPTLKVEVSNDARAIARHWEDATAAVLANEAYEFTNAPASEDDYGISVRVTLTKNSSTERVYVTSLGLSFS